MRPDSYPRVLITGAGAGIGRDCAEALAQCGAELILCDNDARALALTSQALGAVGRFCDVSSEASVAVFAADILQRYPTLDMVINAAGGGYQRTLGMYRVSRALLPALKRGTQHNLLLNVSPTGEEADAAIFPYASSLQAFRRLSGALATEARGTAINVLIACPKSLRISHAMDDREGPWAAWRRAAPPATAGSGALADQVVALVNGRQRPNSTVRRAG